MQKLAAILLTAFLSLAPVPVSDLSNPVQAIKLGDRTYCTAFSINQQAGYWATAAHCAFYAQKMWEEEGETSTIDGEPATIVYVDVFWDVAVFQGAHAPALKLSKRAPVVGQVIHITGYPYGIARVTTWGAVGARGVSLEHPLFHRPILSDILDITTAGGNSGSPVMAADGSVVGILWGGFTASPHAISVPVEALQAILVGFWAR